MMKPLLSRCFAPLCALCLLIQSGTAEVIRTESGAPKKLPEPPFALARPTPQDSKENPIKPESLAKASADALYGASYQFMNDGDTARAIYLRTMVYKKDPSFRGQLELAQWCAESKDIDSAIYWLQQAAIGDQLDEVMEDKLLQPVRDDERWSKLKPFLTAAEKAWRESSYSRSILIVPAGYDASKPIPVMITLHGMGSVPEDFADGASYQALANELQIAILGISGTKPEGKNRFVWKEQFEEDWKHVQAVFEELSKKVTPAKGKCLALGFSQGAQLSAELTAAHPEFFAGAVILSPGYAGPKRLPEALKLGGKAAAAAKFIVAYNDKEHPKTVATSKDIVKQLQDTGAEVYHHAFEGNTHSAPPAFELHLPLWVQFLLQSKH